LQTAVSWPAIGHRSLKLPMVCKTRVVVPLHEGVPVRKVQAWQDAP
jgi:hypothetical protein